MRYLFSSLSFFILNTAIANTIVSCAFPNPDKANLALAQTNCDFHQAYELRVKEISQTLGAVGGRPVLMDLGGNLIFLYNGKKEEYNVTTLPYHELKVFSHAAFSLYLILSQNPSNKLTPDIITELKKLRSDLGAAQKALGDSKLNLTQRNSANHLASMTLNFIDKVLQQNNYNKKTLRVYYQIAGPIIADLINEASGIEIKNLDMITHQWLAKLSQHERNKLGLVLAVSHQARDQEVSLQYFAKALNLKYGSGAHMENGYVIMENQFDEASGLSMLARHYLDRESASFIFGHADHLQTDALANGAKQYFKTNRVKKY